MAGYDFKKIEKKWQEKWDELQCFHAKTGEDKPKFYALVEFPYLCKSVQSVGVFLSYAICGNFLSCAISGTFLSCAISGRNSLFRVAVYLAVYLIIYIVGVEIDEYT